MAIPNQSNRIGIICEGHIGFEDQQVLTHLATKIVGHHGIVCLPQGSKPQLFAECGKVAWQLINTDGCCRVLIVWDLEPTHNEDGACRHNDRQQVFANLAAAGLQNHPCVFLVCIEKELETWLLADGGAIATVLHHPPYPRPHVLDTKSLGAGNPKGRLKMIFKDQGRGREFDPKTDGPAIAMALPANFGALGKFRTFKRFGLKLRQTC